MTAEKQKGQGRRQNTGFCFVFSERNELYYLNSIDSLIKTDTAHHSAKRKECGHGKDHPVGHL